MIDSDAATDLGEGVSSVADCVRALREQIGSALTTTPGSLLDELCALNETARQLREVRDAVLVQVRARGSSWNSISSRTGIAATTWRGRHDRFLEDDQP